MERAAYYKEYAEKKLRGLLHTGSGAPGNTATRIDSYAVTGGTYVYNTYPEIDGLFSEQVNEQNPRVRTQILHKIQQIIHERVMFAPVMEPAFLNGVGPRVGIQRPGRHRQLPVLGALRGPDDQGQVMGAHAEVSGHDGVGSPVDGGNAPGGVPAAGVPTPGGRGGRRAARGEDFAGPPRARAGSGC